MVLQVLSRAIKREKEGKEGIHQKKEANPFLIADDLKYRKSYRIHKKAISININKQCCRQKINTQKSTVFLYTGNGQNEMKWKYSETKLTKNCKSYILKATEHPEKKIFLNLNKQKNIPVPRQKNLILL